MEVATPTTEASLSAINETLRRISMTLGRMAARQDQMLVDSKKMTEALAPIVATTPMSTPGRVLEQQKTKPSSFSLFSAVPVMGAGDPHVDSVVASAMLTTCLTKSPGHYIDNGHAELVFPGSDMTHLPATTSSGDGNCTLQGVGGAGMNTHANCSTHVPTRRPDVSGARACKVDANMTRGPLFQVEEHQANQCPLRPQTSFPRFNGNNPQLWRVKCLEFFKTFNIHECLWVTSARLHMEGIAADWYHTHMLHEPVDDWSQFMNAVEASFAIGDSETHDTVEQQFNLCEASVEGEVFPTVGDLSIFMEEGLDSTTAVCDAVLFEDVSRLDEVLTYVDGVSIFLELDLCSVEERLTQRPFKDIAWDEELADSVLTHVSGLSLFQEYDRDTRQMFRGKADMDKVFDHGVSGAVLVLLAVLAKRCNKLQQVLSQEMQQYATGDTHALPWDPGKQNANINGLFFGWQHHAESCVIQFNLCVVSRSVKDAHVLQPVTDQVLNKLPSWGRGGFSPGNPGQQQSYKCRDFRSFIHSRCCFQYKKWDPGILDTGGCTSGLRKISALELKASVASTSIFHHGIGVSMGSYGTIIVKLEQGQRANCRQCIIKDVTTLPATIKCICDGKLRTLVLVLVCDHAQMMELSSPTTAMALLIATHKKDINILQKYEFAKCCILSKPLLGASNVSSGR